MINGNIDNSPVRIVKGKVELFEGSTLLDTYTYRDRLKSFTVERVGEESKFFGFGVCQKINIKLIDKDRELDISTSQSFKAYLTTGDEYYTPFPTFYVTEVHRDENTNELSITAYDLIYKFSGITFTPDLGTNEEEEETEVLTIDDYAIFCALLGGLSSVKKIDIPDTDTSFSTEHPDGANLGGAETVREVLDDIAEATQTIYYLDNDGCLVFKRLNINDEALVTISKNDYFSLDSKTNRRLVAVCHVTELGDNISASLTQIGTIQCVRENVFWTLREDIGTLVDNALAAIGGITINQFECSWRGNYLLEPGDKIAMVTKDGSTVVSYLLNDTVVYNGYLSQQTQWNYIDNENANDNHNNPTSLGDALKQTYAKVDKANQEISLVVKSVDDYVLGINGSIDELTKTVGLTMTTEDIEAKFTSIKTNGVEQIVTSEKKFTLNDEGLNISDSDSNISTHIDENGMSVLRDSQEVLIANADGVMAEDLHATTYLIIGNNSRFEDYGYNRTGCFWIGG